jgi:phosphate transport system ATP-binding protein
MNDSSNAAKRLAPEISPNGVNQADDPPTAKMTVRGLNFYYGKSRALQEISLDIKSNRITALIGPSGCGKSTFIRTLNRMYELIRHTRVEGDVALDSQSIFGMDVSDLRQRVGMVFQKTNPFPKSIFENVAYGLRVKGEKRKNILAPAVEHSLKRAFLWEEVKEQLHESALSLSGGQQQRLCIARALAVNPEVLLLDEPCSALDPVSTAKIEALLVELKRSCTIVIVTHNMQQAARVSDLTGYFLHGRLIEFGKTPTIFENPSRKETEDYITGRFG